MTYQTSKSSNYNGQTDNKLNDYLVSVDRDLSNLFRMAAPFYQFGSGTSYSVLTYTSTNYQWFSTIGGWSTTNTLLYAGTGSTYMGLQPGVGIWMGSSAFATAVFSVDPTGQMIAHAGRIGGWYIGTTTLSSTNLVFDSGNELIRTQDYVSGALGHGWQIDKNVAEFQNIRARGKITTSVFEKESISSIGGNFLVSDSDLLNADMTAADTSTMTVLGLTSFAINDILRIKDGTSDEWFTVTGSTSALGYTVTRDQGTDYSANANPIWTKGTAVVNFGASGEGLIFMTASETNNPYIDVVTHAGSPWSALTTRVRLGNLNGFLGYVADAYGIAIGESTKYLKYDSTNGLQIKGTVTLDSNSSVSNLAASSVAGWAAGGDTTKIDGGKIYTSSILADSISATAITAVKIATGAITTDKIAANSITSNLVSATAITADKLNITNLAAITVSTGALTVSGNIKSSDYVATTTGFQLSPTGGLEVNTGVITGTIISGSLIRATTYTSGNNTWTCPALVTQVYVTLCAGGAGGGGGYEAGAQGGGGGGAGCLVINYPISVTPGNNYSANVGGGGGGGSSNAAGTNGGSTVFSSLTVTGGIGGQRGQDGGAGGGGANPDAAGPATLKQGIGGNRSGGSGGNGGSSVFGVGGTGAPTGAAAGGAGSGYGSGGGGGAGASGTQSGGAGTGGYILIIW